MSHNVWNANVIGFKKTTRVSDRAKQLGFLLGSHLIPFYEGGEDLKLGGKKNLTIGVQIFPKSPSKVEFLLPSKGGGELAVAPLSKKIKTNKMNNKVLIHSVMKSGVYTYRPNQPKRALRDLDSLGLQILIGIPLFVIGVILLHHLALIQRGII